MHNLAAFSLEELGASLRLDCDRRPSALFMVIVEDYFNRLPLLPASQ